MKIENKHVAILIVISIYLIFYDLIFEWINKEIINNYLSKIRAVPRVHYTFFVLLIVITFYFVHLLKSGKHVSKWLIYTLILASINYCYYRFYSTSYTFLSTPPIPNLKYTDLLIYITAIFSLSWFVSKYFKTKEPKYNNNPFIVDTPVSKSDNDLYNRKDFAQHLAEKIQSRLPKNTIGSVAMGVTGKWGSGKTSFMNMIEEQLDNENRIIFKFNPWLSQSPDNIIDDFFSVMSSELKAYDKEISADLQKYSTAINNVDENIVRKTLASVHDILANGDNKQEYYNKINSSLLASKKQIIVFIDDLDRLDKKEVFAILKLIRNTANFNNLFYVVCYDKQYVEHALTEFSDYGAKTFLEKIFQYEFELPLPNYTLITEKLKLSTIKAFKNQLTTQEIDIAVDFEGYHGSFTSKFIKTPRDIVRFINLLENDYWIIGNNINFTDFYLFSLVKLKFNKIYNDLTNFSDYFFKEKAGKTVRCTINDNNSQISKSLFGLEEQQNLDNNEEDKYIINMYIDHQNDLINYEKEFLKNLFKVLTNPKPLNKLINSPMNFVMEFYTSDSASRDPRSFAFWDTHKNYFTLNLLNSDFPIGEFFSDRKKDSDLFKSKIKQWYDRGYLNEMRNLLGEIKDFENFEEWSKHLKIFQYINSLSSNDLSFHYSRDILMYPLKDTKTIQWDNPTTEDIKTTIIEWFYDSEYPFTYEITIITGILSEYDSSEYGYKQLFSKFDLYEILNTYVSKFTSEKKGIGYNFFNFFYKITRNKIVDEREDDLKNHIVNFEYKRNTFLKENLTTKDLKIFIHVNAGYDDKLYTFNDKIGVYFESIDKLLIFLKEKFNEDKYYNEFLKFKDVYDKRENKEMIYIDFKFEHLKVDES